MTEEMGVCICMCLQEFPKIRYVDFSVIFSSCTVLVISRVNRVFYIFFSFLNLSSSFWEHSFYFRYTHHDFLYGMSAFVKFSVFLA